MVTVFPKSANQPNKMARTLYNNCFRLMRDWKLENLANGTEIFIVPFGMEKEDYLCRCLPLILTKKIRKFRLKVKWNGHFSEIKRLSSFSVQNGTAEISLPFAKLSSFQSLISRQQLQEIELQMNGKRHLVRLVC